MSTRYGIVSVSIGPFPLLNPERTAIYVAVVVKSKRGRLAQLHTVALEVRLSDGRAEAIVVADNPKAPHADEFLVPPEDMSLFLEGVDFRVYPPIDFARRHPELCKTHAEAHAVKYARCACGTLLVWPTRDRAPEAVQNAPDLETLSVGILECVCKTVNAPAGNRLS